MMKKRIIAYILALILSLTPTIIKADGASRYETAKIRVNLGQAVIEKEVLVDNGTIMAPLSWLTYFGLLDKTESNDEYEFFYPEQRSITQYAKRIFISKSNPHTIFVGYYYSDEGLIDELSSIYDSFKQISDDVSSASTKKEALEKFFSSSFNLAKNRSISVRNNYKAIYEGKFSKCIEANNDLYFPITELLPLINAKIGVSTDGDLCISINNSSILRVLYGDNVGRYVFNADQCISRGKKVFDTMAWVTSTIINLRYKRLDFIYKTGEIDDYQSIFEQMLLDDEVYLKTQSEKSGKSEAELGNELLSGTDTALSLLKKLNVSVSSNTGIDDFMSDTVVFENVDILTRFNETLYSDKSNVFDSARLSGLSKKVGYISDVYDYWYTYNYQVDDHRKMLSAVYNYALRNGITNMDLYASGTAAKSVEAQYNESFTTAALAKLGDTFFDKAIGKLTSNKATEKLFGTLTTAISLTTSILKWNDYTKNAIKLVDDSALLNHYDAIADTAYDVFSNVLYNEQFDSNHLETLRLSALLTLTASKYGYSSPVFENTYNDDVSSISELLRKLYLAADGTICEGSDYYEKEKSSLNQIVSKISISKGSNKPKEPEETKISIDSSMFVGLWKPSDGRDTTNYLNISKISNSHITFFLGFNTYDANYVVNTDYIEADISDNGVAQFEYIDSLKNYGHGTITLTESGVHLNIVADGYTTDTKPIYGIIDMDEELFKISDIPGEPYFSSSQTFSKQGYGWSIELPDDWYVSFEEEDGYGMYGCTYFSSNKNASEEGFIIYAVSLGSEKDDKQKGVYFAAYDCGYLGENSKYAFYWSITGVGARYPDPQTPNLTETVRSMLNTFKLN